MRTRQFKCAEGNNTCGSAEMDNGDIILTVRPAFPEKGAATVSDLVTVIGAEGFDQTMKQMVNGMTDEQAQVLQSMLATKVQTKVLIRPTPAIENLMLWLQDNVEEGTPIHFDNDGEIRSEHALEEMGAIFRQSAD